MSEDPTKVIDLGSKEIDPAEALAYREKVRQARGVAGLKASEPVGVEPRPQMPILKNQSRRDAPVEPASKAEGVQPRPPGSPTIRPETKQQLDEAIRAGEVQKEKDSAAILDEAKVREQAALFEAFDFGDMSRQVDRILDNKKRRQDIESRCEPMDLEDLLMKDEVRQRVPILPGKFEPTFRSITPLESLFIKRRMSKETITTDQYLGEKYNLMLLTCCLVDINGAPLPDHRDIHGEIDETLFDEKAAALMKKSGYIVADLSVNYIWFDIRVRRLLNPDDLKNG
jgi:hypothetical protein